MEKTIKIRSSFLSVLNEALQKLTLNDTVKNFTPVIVEADGKFTSVVKTENEFDPSVLGANIDTEEDETENDIQKKETREQLLNKAKDAMQQTIDSSSNLKDILKKIEELSKSDDNKWQLNKEHNTASLPSRNTYIFKQNNNLCVSHKGKIELFKSVEELRKWLKDNKYPLPDDSIVIHESVDIKEHIKGDAGSSDYFGKHGNNGRNWVDLYYQYKERDRQNQENNVNNKKSDILSDEKVKANAEIIKDFEEIQRQALAGKNALIAKVEQLDKEYLAVAKNVWSKYTDDDLNKNIKAEKKAKLTAAKQALEDYCNNDPIYQKYLSFLGEDGYVKGKVADAYSANNAHIQASIKQNRDDTIGLSKRVPDEVYKADMHKKDEPVVSDKYLNFDDEMDECCGGIGGGITSVANLGPFVQHVANKVKKKKEEEKEALEEALTEEGNFPDFDPQNGANVRNQAGKVAEKFVNSFIEKGKINTTKLKQVTQDLKDGKFAPLPFTKEEYFDVLQSTYYDYAKTHVGNSNWPKKVKETLREEASDLLNKFQNQELDPIENEIVSNFIQVYQETKPQEEITTEGLVNDLALALNDLFRKNNPQFAEFNQKLAAKLTNTLNRDFGEIKVEIKPGDVLLYGKDIIDDTENPDSRAVLYKLNKHIRNEKDENDDGGSLEARKQWNVENFKIYMEKRNISNVLKALYDAVYSPDSKAKFSKQNDSYVDSWKTKWKKDKGEYIKLLTDEEIEEIKASWNQAKAEIKQEEPTVEPTPQEIKAEIEQEDVLTDKEQEILNTLMSINRSLDPTKYTTSQLREMIKTVMGLGKKQESIYESAMKHPWLNKLMGQRLVEDDSPADFATGSPISSDMDSAAASADTSSTTTDTTSTPDIDMGGGAAPAAPNGFGDIDISVGGYDPEGEGDEGGAPAPNAPEYDIVDVLANTDDPTDIKVKIRNSETGEVEIKDLSEI